MDDETVPQIAEQTAPEPEVTAAPETVETTLDEQPVDETTKTFTQEELDAAVSKRLARERRKWEREQAAPRADTPSDTTGWTVEDFGSPEAYAEALAEVKARQLVEAREAERQQSEVFNVYYDREEAARDKYDDFDQVAYNQNLPVTDTMAQAIMASDAGPDVLYWLGANPQDAARIARLSPVQQAKEIGRIEATLGSSPPVRKTTTAPPPIAPVTARSTGNPAYDTTDPRSIKNMSTSEWIEAERQRQMRKMEAQRNR